MAGLGQKVRALLDEGVSERDDITERILLEADESELMEMIRPVLLWNVGMLLRGFARSHEKRAFPDGHTEVSQRRTSVDELRNLIASSFALEDGTRVTWGEATVEQHQRRAAMLRTHADRVIETANRHEKAAEMISKAGATCLADLLDEPQENRQAA